MKAPHFFKMGIHNQTTHKLMMLQRERGRPRIAADDVRANGYKNEAGRDVLSNGLKPWHERVVDFMVMNPHAKIVDIANAFGVTPVWVGRLLKTDAFVSYYKARMSDHQDVIGQQIVHKMQSVAVKALDKMAEKLVGGDLTFGQVKDAVDTTLKGLGYTSNVGATHVNVQASGHVQATVMVQADAVARAREKLSAHMKENTKMLESGEQTTDDYQQVTSSMDLGVEDAVVIERYEPKS